MLNKFFLKYNNLPLQIKASIWFGVCSFVQKGISVVTIPIFTRIMSEAEFGQYNLFISWQSILCIFITLNLPWGVFEQGLIKCENKKEFVYQLQSLLTCILLIWFVFYFIFREKINLLCSLSNFEMVMLFAFSWTSSIFCFWTVSQRVDYHYKSLVVLTLLMAFLKPTLSIIFINILSNSVYARILGIVLIEGLFCIPLAFYQFKSGSGSVDFTIWRYAVSFNIVLIPHFLAQSILASSDKVMIGKMVGRDAVGIYSLAYSISQVAIVFNTVIQQVLGPWIFRTLKSETSRGPKKNIFLLFVVVGVLNLSIIWLTPEILSFFAPQTYGAAMWVMPPITMSVFFIFLYGFFAYFELYGEKTRFISIATIGSALLNVILNYLMIPRYGYLGASYATLICYMLYALFHYIVVKTKCSFLDMESYVSSKQLFGVTFMFLICSFVGMYLFEYRFVRCSILLIGIGLLIHKSMVKGLLS